MDWVDEAGTRHQDCAIVFRTREQFGGLSNMASGYPLRVNGIEIPSSEALYQACRFPHRPDWQLDILVQRNGMMAKMMAKKGGRREHDSRPDWDEIRLEVMRWVLELKLAQHQERFGGLLRATGDRAIVERSRRDVFWGAVEGADGVLRGQNQLGRLLMELRARLTAGEAPVAAVEPPSLPGFYLLGDPIGAAPAAAAGLTLVHPS